MKTLNQKEIKFVSGAGDIFPEPNPITNFQLPTIYDRMIAAGYMNLRKYLADGNS